MISYYKFSESLHNPTLKRRIQISFHVTYIASFLFIYVPSFHIGWPLQFPHFFFRDVFEYGLISVFVYILYFSKGQNFNRKRIPMLAVLTSLMLILLTILAHFKNLEIHSNATSFMYVFDDMMQYIGFGFVLFILILCIHNIDSIFSNRYYKIKETLEATRNQLLRQQFHPHFLFNALNSIYSMSLNSHPQTADAILKLSGMMRYLTDEVNVARIPLEREIKFLREYISIEKIRFGENADIQFNTTGSSADKFIEPLLLIPLVENAFKHGFYTNNPSSFVHIDLKMEEDSLIFSCRNSIMNNGEKQSYKREGKGLEILKNRLHLSYSKSSKLLLSQNNNIYHAELNIKMEA